MRRSAYYFIAFSAILGGSAVVQACGSSVDTDTSASTSSSGGKSSSSSSNGGSGGKASSSVATGGGSSSSSIMSDNSVQTVATTGVGGAGGASNCTIACDKAQMCFGVDYCGQAGIDCNNLTPQEQCIADCGADPMTTCNNITGCQSKCSGMTTTGTGGTGAGGAPTQDCQMLCSLVQMCFGFNGCQLGGIDCGNLSQQNQCVVECIDATMPTCNNLSMQVFQQCQSQCQMSSSATGTGGAGGATSTGVGGAMSSSVATSTTATTGSGNPACLSCADMDCGNQLGTCEADTTCASWLMCSGVCFNNNAPSSCFTACDAMYPGAKTDYDAIYSCACTSCSNECSNADPCGAH